MKKEVKIIPLNVPLYSPVKNKLTEEEKEIYRRILSRQEI